MRISKIRKIMINYHFGVFMSAVMLFCSCSKEQLVADLTKTQSSETTDGLINSSRTMTFSDLEVFKGIMFFDGPVAEKMPAFSDFNIRTFIKDSTTLNAALAFQDSIINHIISVNSPNYFSEFRTEIRSGDYYRVKTAIIGASNDIYEASLILSNTQNAPNLNAIASSFRSEYHLNPQSSETEMMDAIKDSFAKAPKNYVRVVYVHTYLVALLAGVIILVLFAIVENGGSQSHSVNNYMMEHYLTDVTLNLTDI
jgi:SdpC family antimicrobial peptide